MVLYIIGLGLADEKDITVRYDSVCLMSRLWQSSSSGKLGDYVLDYVQRA